MNGKGDAHRLKERSERCKSLQFYHDLLNTVSPKTADFKKFLDYTRVANTFRSEIIKDKLSKFWKRSMFEGYQSRQSALDRPLAII